MSEPTLAQPGAPGTITIPVDGPPPAFDPRTGEPLQPPPALDPNGVWGAGVVPPTPPAGSGAVTPPQLPQTQPAPTGLQPVEINGQRYWTADALEAARREEREKLYGRLEEQGAKLNTVTEFVEEERKKRQEAEAEALAAAERERTAGLSLDQRVAEMEQSWSQRFAAQEQQIATSQAVLDQERRFNAISEYRTRRVTEEQELIHPSLIDLVTGATEAEVEASITAMKQKTDAIVQDMQGQQVVQRQVARGVAPTGAPPVVPSENSPGQTTFTAQDIAQMDPATYKKHRAGLLQAASQRAATGTLYQN